MSLFPYNHNPFLYSASLIPGIGPYASPYGYNPYYESLFPFGGYAVNYQDLNTDLKLQKKVLNNLWDKLSEKWIFTYDKVFKFIRSSAGSYKLVSSVDEAENNNDTKDLKGKAEWILSNLYKKSNLASTIEKFRSKTGLNWWNVEASAEKLCAFVYHQMRRMILNNYIN